MGARQPPDARGQTPEDVRRVGMRTRCCGMTVSRLAKRFSPGLLPARGAFAGSAGQLATISGPRQPPPRSTCRNPLRIALACVTQALRSAAATTAAASRRRRGPAPSQRRLPVHLTRYGNENRLHGAWPAVSASAVAETLWKRSGNCDATTTPRARGASEVLANHNSAWWKGLQL